MDAIEQAIIDAYPHGVQFLSVPYSSHIGRMLAAVSNATGCELTPLELWERIYALRERCEIFDPPEMNSDPAP